jgi:sulfur carrier protein
MTMKAIVNGDEREIPEACTLADLLRGFGISLEGTAVAVNESVVAKGSYESVDLHANDRIEIIKAVAGG